MSRAAIPAEVRRRPARFTQSEYQLPKRTQWALAQMSPELAAEVGGALVGGSKRRGLMAPRHRDDDSQNMAALGVLDAYRALADYGVTARSIAEMTTVEALDIIARRVPDVIWEEVNLCRVLCAVRQIHRYIHDGYTPGPLKHRISFYLRAARRDQWDRVRTPGECIAAAVAASGLADILAAIGREDRGRRRFRDAVILAVAAEINFRTQEFHHIDVASVTFESANGVDEAWVSADKTSCKNRRGKIGVVRDLRAVGLLRRLIGTRTAGPLFCNDRGGRLSQDAIASALRRTSLSTLGVPLSPNLVRRAGASDEDDEAEMARRIGDRNGGRRTGVAVRHYSKSKAREGLALLREPDA